MSRWMMPFWCACWIASQTWANSAKTSAGRQGMLVAIFGDLETLHQLHHKIRPPAFGRAGIEDVGDVSDVPSAPAPAVRPQKRAITLLVSMPGLISLSATRRTTGSRCLARKNHPAATFPPICCNN